MSPGDLPAIVGVEISPADIPVEPSALVTWADVEAVLSEGPLVEGSTTERRKAKDLEYLKCVYRPRQMPSVTVAIAGARVSPEAFHALEPPEGSVEPVEGLGDAASFARAASSLRVLKGSLLLVISVKGHSDLASREFRDQRCRSPRPRTEPSGRHIDTETVSI